MAVSRRAVLTAAVTAAGAIAAGCGRPMQTRSVESGGSGVPTSLTSPTGTALSDSRARTAAPVGPAIELAHGSRGRPQVALTFHGAGDLAIVRELLAIFAEHRAKVTVMAVGTWLAANPQIAQEIAGAGHELGNHTYTHPDLNSLSPSHIGAEIDRCRDLLVSQVGSGGIHFRQSQAQHATPTVLRLAGAAGYRTVLSYDVDSLDYTDPGADAVRRAVSGARAGSIVSMHFGHPGTVSAMPSILSDLASRRLAAVTAGTLLAA